MKDIFGDNSDADLIKAAGGGNHKAFELIVNRYKEPLYNFVCRYLQDHSSAEEVVQEVFLRIYKAAPKYKVLKNTKASTWIFKIAFNLSMNELKSRRRYSQLIDNHADQRKIPAVMEASVLAERREMVEAVMAGLRLLPENQRAALLLRVQQEFSYREISEILNTSVSSVESLIYRARQHMKKHIDVGNKE